MRIVFCGTPEFALPTLQRLIAVPEFSVETVITQPDRPRGRGQAVSSPPVKEAALDAGIHVFQPEKIKSDSAYEFFERTAPDAVVIIAYGQIVPASLLNIPRLGWIKIRSPRYSVATTAASAKAKPAPPVNDASKQQSEIRLPIFSAIDGHR